MWNLYIIIFYNQFIENLKKNSVQVTKMPELYISLLTAPEKDSRKYDDYLESKKLVSFIIKKDK